MKKSHYYFLFKTLCFAFLFYPLTRILFYLFNLDYFSDSKAFDIVLAFLYGLRFDLSTMLIVNSVYIILSVIPFRHKFYQFFLKIIFTFSNMIMLGINIVDVEFFKFIGKKITIDIFDMGGDIQAQSMQLIINYWYLALIVLAIGHLLFHNGPKVKTEFYEKKISLLKTIPLGFLLIVTTFIGIRGGLQMRSISPKQAFVFDQHELGNLVLNSVYTLVRSLETEKVEKVSYFKSRSDVKAKLLTRTHELKFENPQFKNNVVIIIIESLSQEYVNEGYAPFFSELATKSLYFDQNYANGRRSIEALPSIMTGLPSLLGKPISQSQFQTNKFISLPAVLKTKGYSTHFFHGGKRGTMDFDAYTASIGFDHYYGKEDYPDSSHYDGNWGIFDHYFYKYMINELDKTSKPFISTFFSLSSHQPYTIPLGFENKFNKGKLEIHESIGYADKSLKLFFDEARTKEWFKKTLFIITADHTQKLHSKEFNSLLGRYRVPLLIYHPDIDLSAYQKERITQHADIMPTVLDFLGNKDAQTLLYGRSVFSDVDGRAVNRSGDLFFILNERNYVTSLNDAVKTYQYPTGEEQKNSPNKVLEEELKASLQYYFNGLKFNDIYR